MVKASRVRSPEKRGSTTSERQTGVCRSAIADERRGNSQHLCQSNPLYPPIKKQHPKRCCFFVGIFYKLFNIFYFIARKNNVIPRAALCVRASRNLIFALALYLKILIRSPLDLTSLGGVTLMMLRFIFLKLTKN